MDKKSIIGAAACVVLFLLWPKILLWTGMQAEPPPSAAIEAAAVPGTAAAMPGGETPPPAAGTSTAVNAAASVAPVPAGELLPEGPSSRDIGRPGVDTATVDLRTGALTSVRLEAYRDETLSGPQTLGHNGHGPGALTLNGKPLAGRWERVASDDPQSLVVERRLGAGLLLRQTWAARSDESYRWDYVLEFINTGTQTAKLARIGVGTGEVALPAAQLARSFFISTNEYLSADLRTAGEKQKTEVFTEDAVYAFAGPAAATVDKHVKKRAELAATPVSWGAVHTKYFTFMVTGSFRGAAMSCETDAGQRENGLRYLGEELLLPELVLEPGKSCSVPLTVYAGPKERQLMRHLPDGVEGLLQMNLFFFWQADWMGWLARQILGVMVWVHGVIGRPWAWGLAIILITVCVKLLFWPLTHYTTLSMKKMQSLQPLVEEAKAKFKDSPQLAQQRVMEIYREHGVNPLGGCLPVLFQIPVFFALFNVFRGAIELRQAQFLWVRDLSQPDTLQFLANVVPIRPFAILCGLTMLLQQMVTPSSMDPAQKKMMMVMTVVFAVVFYGMPAGLTLYWTVNQGLGIVQTLITFRLVQQIGPHYQGAAVKKG